MGFLDQHRDAAFCFHRTRSLTSLNATSDFVLPPQDLPEISSGSFLLQESNPVALHTVMARRAYLANLSTWVSNLKLGDWPLCVMLATMGTVGYLPREMSRYRVHDGGSWTRMRASLREAYVIQMLSRLSTLLSGDEKTAVDRRRENLAAYWANDVICNQEGSPSLLMDAIASLQDPELSTYLLVHVVERAQRIQEARKWHESQSQAWEAAATEAAKMLENRTASEQQKGWILDFAGDESTMRLARTARGRRAWSPR